MVWNGITSMQRGSIQLVLFAWVCSFIVINYLKEKELLEVYLIEYFTQRR